MARVLTAGTLTGILLSGTYALHGSRRQLIGAFALLVPGVVLTWIDVAMDNDTLRSVALIAQLLFLAYATSCVLALVVAKGPVTSDRLAGSVAVYLLFGIAWALAFKLLEHAQPGSFTVSTEGEDLFYFSFVTLTTLGYGDISPVSRPARTLALLEAIVAQLYLAILVARLVALHLAEALKRTPNA